MHIIRRGGRIGRAIVTHFGTSFAAAGLSNLLPES